MSEVNSQTQNPVQAAAHNEAKEKIRQVFRFLAELQRVRTPAVRRVDDYEWHLYLSNLPPDSAIELGHVALLAAPDPSSDAPAPEGEDHAALEAAPQRNFIL